MRRVSQFALEESEIGKAAQFILESLKLFVPQRDNTKTSLIARDAIESLIKHSNGKGSLRISLQKPFGRTTIEMSAPGYEYNLMDNIHYAAVQSDEDVGQQALDNLRHIMLRSLGGDLRYRHKDGYNYVRITLYRYRRNFLYKTLAAFFSSIVFALVLSALAPQSIGQVVNDYVLSPVKTIYLNTLRMVIAPVVFFSIVHCISGFSNLRELGKIGTKTLLLYFLTTIVAVSVGIGAFYLFKPGHTTFITDGVVSSQALMHSEISIRENIINIFPSNIVKPFLTDNMPQLIILSVLCGVATGLIGQYSIVLTSLFSAFNELFMKIVGILINFMPVAIFCSIASMILITGTGTLLSILGMMFTFIFGLIAMIAFYMILMVLLGRLNSIVLLKKYFPTMVQAFSIASSNAAIPFNIEACQTKLGISSKVCSLTIPLGSTLNMHGTCIMLSVFALAIAKVYGMTVSSGNLITMAVTIIILSIGAPGIPGGVVICLSVLLEQLHVPAEGVSLIMGIGPLIGMFLCMSNCLGDVVVTAIVAKSSGEMDMNVFKKLQ